MYATPAESLSKMQPVPASVKSFTEEELGIEAARADAKTFKEIVEEFLSLCTTLVKKPGRGTHSGSVKPLRTDDMNDKFREWSKRGSSPWDVFKAKGYRKAGYNGVHCYQFGDEILMMRDDAPAERKPLLERS